MVHSRIHFGGPDGYEERDQVLGLQGMFQGQFGVHGVGFRHGGTRCSIKDAPVCEAWTWLWP